MEQYAFGRLAAALESAARSPDPAVRARAAGKAARWQAALAGMASGELTIGSRTPVAGTPAWVTLEVLHGGFVTGAYLAEQPVDAAERSRLRPDQPGGTDRERVNLWWLSDAGQAELVAALRTDRYRVDLPEHAALATIALLVDRGRPEPALDLLAELRPLLHRLRFSPTLVSRPERSGHTVHLRTAGEVAAQLREARTRPQLARMRATLGVWQPLVDELVGLWLETVDGEPPRLGPDGVTGGWPARVFPPGWAARRADWLARWAAAGPPTGRHAHPRSNAGRLRHALAADQLTARDVGWVRRALANTLSRHPVPRERWVATPTHADHAHAVAQLLDRHPADEGLPDLAELPPDTPRPVVAKAARALEAPLPELVRRRIVPSGEVLAELLPQLTARYAAAGIVDPVAAGLYARTYAAFRRRRSLLLLDLESQVRFEELPWVAALDGFREADDRDAARAALRETVQLALTRWPGVVLPNPLVTELRMLARRGALRLPLVSDLAADIFQGTFTTLWRDAAAVASRTLAGTPYAAYYDLPEDWPVVPVAPVLETGRRWPWRRRTAEAPAVTPRTAQDFAESCRERAREAGAAGGVAGNGAVLEQAAILTTANLAALVDATGLTGLGELAEPAFHRAVSLVDRMPAHGHARLLAVKNSAYAWRQAVFFLGQADTAERADTMEQLVAATADGPLAPATAGLRHVLAGERFGPDGRTPSGGRRFLGWTTDRHWLLTS